MMAKQLDSPAGYLEVITSKNFYLGFKKRCSDCNGSTTAEMTLFGILW